MEAAVGVRRVFGVTEDGFVEVVGQRQGRGWRDGDAEFELGAAVAVESGAVVDFFDEIVVVVGGGGGGDGLILVGDAGFEGVEVGFHEPGQRFQIDELDGGGQRWVRK